MAFWSSVVVFLVLPFDFLLNCPGLRFARLNVIIGCDMVENGYRLQNCYYSIQTQISVQVLVQKL